MYLKKHASWKVLKRWLSDVSGGKCWYCEAKHTRAPLDVDHFRPKLGITVDGSKLAGDTGYYWIAYEWWNFRLSCQRCNRPETDVGGTVHGKAEEFPLQDEGARCTVPGASLATEVPRLLDPCIEEDCHLLAHGIDGEVKPAAPAGTWEFERAQYTIKQLGFNAFNSPESKKKCWRLLDDLIRLAGNHPDVAAQIELHMSRHHEYSSFFRSAIGTHRDKPWVDALL
ncbi:hypothetical protein IGS68_08495 [Skermanella sp. TT6]|uniref:HNH endonuclease n=1 Tax=Skermanella cutis TaxID=2775420 RepID=A0ABX7BA28_9PROT|nr:hypothetical protein [Skermanella sp. TT6]QQP91229.1 hypothetical protein IGS68_08495 [Skermanella sp. TT6]